MPALGIRTRILVGFVLVLVLATIGSVIVARALVIAQIDRRISEELIQEAGELRRLSRQVAIQ